MGGKIEPMLKLLWWMLRALENKRMCPKGRMKWKNLSTNCSYRYNWPLAKTLYYSISLHFSHVIKREFSPIFDHANRPSHAIMTDADNIEMGIIIQQMYHYWKVWPPCNHSMLHCGYLYLWWDWLVKQSRTQSIHTCEGYTSFSSQCWRRASSKNKAIESWKLVHYHTPLHSMLWFVLFWFVK